MENFTMLIQGFGTALTPMNIGVCMLGAILGLVVGAMPGIGSLAWSCSSSASDLQI